MKESEDFIRLCRMRLALMFVCILRGQSVLNTQTSRGCTKFRLYYCLRVCVSAYVCVIKSFHRVSIQNETCVSSKRRQKKIFPNFDHKTMKLKSTLKKCAGVSCTQMYEIFIAFALLCISK